MSSIFKSYWENASLVLKVDYLDSYRKQIKHLNLAVFHKLTSNFLYNRVVKNTESSFQHLNSSQSPREWYLTFNYFYN